MKASKRDKIYEFCMNSDDIEITLDVEQDDVPVRGNASAWDDETDKRIEDEILERLDRGDVWAWAWVCVKARYKGFEGSDSLGGCSYASEDDFTQPGGYYEDMVHEARERLAEELIEAGEVVEGIAPPEHMVTLTHEQAGLAAMALDLYIGEHESMMSNEKGHYRELLQGLNDEAEAVVTAITRQLCPEEG